MTELTYLNFFENENFLWEFFSESSNITGSEESKEEIFRQFGHNILKHYNALIEIRLTTTKAKRGI